MLFGLQFGLSSIFRVVFQRVPVLKRLLLGIDIPGRNKGAMHLIDAMDCRDDSVRSSFGSQNDLEHRIEVFILQSVFVRPRGERGTDTLEGLHRHERAHRFHHTVGRHFDLQAVDRTADAMRFLHRDLDRSRKLRMEYILRSYPENAHDVRRQSGR